MTAIIPDILPSRGERTQATLGCVVGLSPHNEALRLPATTLGPSSDVPGVLPLALLFIPLCALMPACAPTLTATNSSKIRYAVREDPRRSDIVFDLLVDEKKSRWDESGEFRTPSGVVTLRAVKYRKLSGRVGDREMVLQSPECEATVSCSLEVGHDYLVVFELTPQACTLACHPNAEPQPGPGRPNPQ
jgi:hypothetical protein